MFKVGNKAESPLYFAYKLHLIVDKVELETPQVTPSIVTVISEGFVEKPVPVMTIS